MEAATLSARVGSAAGTRRHLLGDIGIVAGAAFLAASLFAPWYQTERDNPSSLVNGLRGDVSAWDTHEILRIILLVVAAHAITHLAFTVIARLPLGWVPGQASMHAAVNGFGIVVFCGFVDRPGEPMSTIGLAWGYWVALAAVIVMFAGTCLRVIGSEKRRPPGALR